jgi:putative endonuclease
MRQRFFVYLLASQRNGTLYVGVTNDVTRRMSEHKAKLVPGFTRQYDVDKLVYIEEYNSILEARARERSLKRWRRAWKIDLYRETQSDLARPYRSPLICIPIDIPKFWVPVLQRTVSRCAAPGTRIPSKSHDPSPHRVAGSGKLLISAATFG